MLTIFSPSWSPTPITSHNAWLSSSTQRTVSPLVIWLDCFWEEACWAESVREVGTLGQILENGTKRPTEVSLASHWIIRHLHPLMYGFSIGDILA